MFGFFLWPLSGRERPNSNRLRRINNIPKNHIANAKSNHMEYEEITHKIIGAAYKVYNQLEFGFLESVYHSAMLIELAKYDLKVESEKPLNVFYDEQVVGEFNVDLFVNNAVVVELKSVQNLAKSHEVQLVNYLNGLRKEIGLLINFSPSGVEVKRKHRKPVTET